MARGGAAWALGLVLLAVGAGAQAQAVDPALRKLIPPTLRAATPAPGAAAAKAASTPPGGPDIAGAQVAPLPGADRLRTPALGAVPTAAKPPALRSAIRSRWSAPAVIASRGGGACRAQCATSRIACLAPVTDEEVPRCNAAWTGCLSNCADLAYGRAPVTP